MYTQGISWKNITPTHKVGIKLLTDLQMTNLFPNYKNLINRIENHRSQIKQLEVCNLRHYQYSLMYDNVFSVFGKRGTGKTSVAFTLQRMIEEDRVHPYDVVLPIIIPEVIPSDCSALGWILAIVKDQILELEKEWAFSQNVSDEKADAFWENCRVSVNDDGKKNLSKKVDELVGLYFSGKYNPSNESSYHLAVGNSARQAQDYYKFAQRITELWDDWVKLLQDLHLRKTNRFGSMSQDSEKIVPLIYFIFDDVDLAPEKVSELMSIIIKYLSHPNIIVITTADEEMFLEVIENNLDKDIGRIPKEWRIYLNNKASSSEIDYGISRRDPKQFDLISETARLYLGKVMPTSTRYYLKLFENAEEKQWFRLTDEVRLGDGVSALIEDLIKYSDNDNCRNFFNFDGRRINFYLNFFGDTSRQIGNAYLAIQEFLGAVTETIEDKRQDMISVDEYTERVFNSCWHFLHVATNANHDLAEQIGDIEQLVDGIFWLEHNGSKLYINYSFLQDFLIGFIDKDEENNIMQMALQLYSLLLFVENILLVLESCTSEGITGRKRIHGIGSLVNFICGHVFENRRKFRTDMAAEEFLFHYQTFLNKLCYMVESQQNTPKFNLEYFYDFLDYPYTEITEDTFIGFLERDKEWLQEISEALSLVYGNLYLIENQEIEDCCPYKEEKILCAYQKHIESILWTNLRNSLDHFNLKAIAEQAIGEQIQYIEDKKEATNRFRQYSRDLYQCLKDTIVRRTPKKFNIDTSSMNEGEMAEKVQLDDNYASCIPLEEIIRKIEENCREKNLSEILCLLPGGMINDIYPRLSTAKSGKDILLVLKILYEFIIRWDNRESKMILTDPAEFLEAAYDIGKRDGVSLEINKIADHLLSYFDDTSSDAQNTILIEETKVYENIKNTLERILESETETTKKLYNYDTEYIQWKNNFKKIGRYFDIAVDIEKGQELQNAILLGIVIQLIKHVQANYLYWTITDKYQMEHMFSSCGLEKMTIRTATERTRKKEEKNAYYYEMFLQMENFLNKEEDELTSDLHNAMQGLIWKSAKRGRNSYITKRINEVRDESF